MHRDGDVTDGVQCQVQARLKVAIRNGNGSGKQSRYGRPDPNCLRRDATMPIGFEDVNPFFKIASLMLSISSGVSWSYSQIVPDCGGQESYSATSR